MAERNKALEAQVDASAKEVDTLRSKMEAVRKESLIDALTGLANRRSFDEQLTVAIAEAEREATPLCVLMCDIDHFKKFNDTWGHATGDQVLRLVAQCLSSNVKGRDTAARYGGEELVVVLPKTSLAAAMTVAEQIRKAVESRKIIKKATGETLGQVTLSIGGAEYKAGEAAADFVSRADACLYAAKRAGRNRVCARVGEDGGGHRIAS
jgi:diguanylate cyclase